MSLMEAAEAVRQQGRFGDTVLMHVNPDEAKALAAGSGGYLTTNPNTGLPEAFLPALLPVLGGLGGTALATSGALAGLGTLGGLTATLAANPFLAGAIGSGIGKTLATGDLGEGLKTGLIAGATGGILQGLSGGDFITSTGTTGQGADAAFLPGSEAYQAAAAGDSAAAQQILNPTENIQTFGSAIPTVGNPQAAQQAFASVDEGVVDVASSIPPGGFGPLPQGQFDVGLPPAQPSEALTASPLAADKVSVTDQIFSPATPSYVDPATGEIVKGQFSATGELIKGLGTEVIGSALTPPPEFEAPEEEEIELLDIQRERFTPPEDYRPGIDPEFRFFGDPVFVPRNPVRSMEEGGLASLSEVMSKEIDESMKDMSDTGEVDKITLDAVAALRGEHPDPNRALVMFTEQYGTQALDALAMQVQQEAEIENMVDQETGMMDMMQDADGLVPGVGGGRDDSIRGSIDGKRDLLVSSGEFVLPADVVSGLGDGNTKAGEAELMALIDRVRTRRTGTKEPPNMVGDALPA